jgi:hypothetical protein
LYAKPAFPNSSKLWNVYGIGRMAGRPEHCGRADTYKQLLLTLFLLRELI